MLSFRQVVCGAIRVEIDARLSLNEGLGGQIAFGTHGT
jgi:hypothetical protein